MERTWVLMLAFGADYKYSRNFSNAKGTEHQRASADLQEPAEALPAGGRHPPKLLLRTDPGVWRPRMGLPEDRAGALEDKRQGHGTLAHRQAPSKGCPKSCRHPHVVGPTGCGPFLGLLLFGCPRPCPWVSCSPVVQGSGCSEA